jgi:hypothetical protein
MLACGALSCVNATPSDSKFQDTFNFDFKIGNNYSLEDDEAYALYHALYKDTSLISWNKSIETINTYSRTDSFGFTKNESVIDLVSTASIDPIDHDLENLKFQTIAHKPYQRSSVIQVPYCYVNNEIMYKDIRVNINIHE